MAAKAAIHGNHLMVRASIEHTAAEAGVHSNVPGQLHGLACGSLSWTAASAAVTKDRYLLRLLLSHLLLFEQEQDHRTNQEPGKYPSVHCTACTCKTLNVIWSDLVQEFVPGPKNSYSKRLDDQVLDDRSLWVV